MQPITIKYAFRPVTRSLVTGQVCDLFGLAAVEPDYVIADQLQVDIQAGDLALFTGPSGSGKSSLLRAVAAPWPAVDAQQLALPNVPLVEAWGGSLDERLALLSACGLAEARLLLRTPSELSDGQRYRFRLAFALAQAREQGAVFVVADEFAAYLDRTLAKVLAFNMRKLATRLGIGLLVATTHDDLTADLRPDCHVQCRGMGRVQVQRDATARQPQPISFAHELRVAEGTRADWEAFAPWHYRSHHLAFVRRVVLLKHRDEAIGIVVFTAPAASLRLRTQYFGLRSPRSRSALQALNSQLWLLARVVLHPTYRGAGIATDFVRQACASCPVPWIETLSAMGHVNPFFERAGFVRIGVCEHRGESSYGGQFGTRTQCSEETIRKSRFSAPIYYVYANENHAQGSSQTQGVITES